MTTTSAPGWEGILAGGETILWQGQPDARIAWGDLLSFQSLFGLFFAGFSLFWIAAAAAMTGGTGRDGIEGVFAFFPLFGIPFLLVGLYLVVGRIFWDAYVRGRTWYTLTNQAAFIAREIRGKRSLKRYPFADMTSIDLRDDTPGSVYFAEEINVYRRSSGGRNGLPRRTRSSTHRIPIGFRRIEDARRVYRLIQDHRNATQTP